MLSRHEARRRARGLCARVAASCSRGCGDDDDDDRDRVGRAAQQGGVHRAGRRDLRGGRRRDRAAGRSTWAPTPNADALVTTVIVPGTRDPGRADPRAGPAGGRRGGDQRVPRHLRSRARRARERPEHPLEGARRSPRRAQHRGRLRLPVLQHGRHRLLAAVGVDRAAGATGPKGEFIAQADQICADTAAQTQKTIAGPRRRRRASGPLRWRRSPRSPHRGSRTRSAAFAGWRSPRATKTRSKRS